MIQLDEILSTAIIRLEQTEQAQWKKINELEQQNMILQDENMHLKDYLAEAEEHNKRMMARLYPVPCITNRPNKEAKNGTKDEHTRIRNSS
jgi:regulator of replication initiation timing